MINYRWISKWMGKGFKNCLENRKVKKSRAFRTPCKNPKSQFTRVVKNSQTQLHLAKIS